MAYWPTYTAVDVVIPSEMIAYQEVFAKFYHTKYTGRKLQWQPNLGHAVLKARFKAADKELKVSLFQALCLLVRLTLTFYYDIYYE
jgi:cullin-4